MSPERIRLLSELFDACLDLDARVCESFIAAQCAGDAELEAELRRLLMRHVALEGKRTRSPLDDTAHHFENTEPPVLVAGQMLGPYRVDEEIGRGGMGRVFRATRTDGAFAQDVAIKVVRRDRMNPALLKRFSTERTVLAALDHPGISRLLDASTLSDGTPYVVMELVRGEHITQYCDARQLALGERVVLFRKVLDAVAHAHRNLIVHRDIKDSNVLVTTDGQPKLLDFGIAKPLSDSEHGETATADRFFTPSHAAPEQLRGGPVTIGCDVYSLGVLLYELLAGRAPFEFLGLTPGEIERLILAVPPPAMAGRMAADAAASSRHGARDAREWQRQLGGDLEAIVQRALRKEPGERYATIEQFDADLANYLGNRPVAARGTQSWYRARKFAARNRASVALGVAALLGLAITGTAIALQNLALKRERDRVTVERDRAALERDRAEFAVEFLSDAFTQADPAQVGGADVTARTILEAARPRVEKLRKTHPGIHGPLATSLARVHLALGLNEEASALAVEARKSMESLDADQEAMASLRLLEAEALINSGKYDEATLALDWLEREGQGASADWKFLKGRMLTLRSEDPQLAISLLTQAAHSTAARPPTDERANQIRWQLAEAHRKLQQRDEGLAVLDRILEWQSRGLEADHPRVVLTRIRRVEHLRGLQRLEEALAQAQATAPRILALYGEGSSLTALAYNALGNALSDNGRQVEAGDAFTSALSAYRGSLGNRHRITLRSQLNLGQVLRTLPGREQEAEAHLREASTQALTALGATDALTFFFTMQYGDLLLARGRPEEALSALAFDEATTAARKANPGNQQEYARLMGIASSQAGCSTVRAAAGSRPCRVAARFLEVFAGP